MVYSESQLSIIEKYRPELKILPTNMDIFVMEFLRIYEVNAQPTDVGLWNGWDTLSALDSLLNISRGGTSVASAIFYAGRSMQISQRSKQGAEDWTTWKKWALDHDKFDEFKNKRKKEIEAYNESVFEKINSKQLKEELDFLIIKTVIRESFIKSYKPYQAFLIILIWPSIIIPITIIGVLEGNPIIYVSACIIWIAFLLFIVNKAIPNGFIESIINKEINRYYQNNKNLRFLNN